MLLFVINMDGSVERMANIGEQLNSLCVQYQRVSAIDGRKLSESEFNRLTYPLTHIGSKVKFTRELTKGEVGCFLSHKLCWEKLLTSNEKWALILEDDVVISPHAGRYLKCDDWLPPDVKLCQLNSPCELKWGRIGKDRKEVDSNITLVQPIYPTPVGGFAYFISREAAFEAVKLSDKFPAPVDDFLFSPWFEISKKFTVWRTSPSLVIPRNDVLSDIGDRSKKSVRKASFFIRHGLRRFLLDYNIKRFQRRGEEFIFKYWK